MKKKSDVANDINIYGAPQAEQDQGQTITDKKRRQELHEISARI